MPSTVIASIRYDKPKQDLYIRFVSGDLYRYKKVPAEVYENLLHAPSKGIFLNKSIKGNYEFQKIDKDKWLSKK